MNNLGVNGGPDMPMWRVARQWHGDFFQMRRFGRYFSFDASGIWTYPAFSTLPDGDIGWLHLMLPAKPLKKDSQRLLLYPPACLAITPANSTTLIKYQDIRYLPDLDWVRTMDEPIARYPTARIGKMTLREFRKAEANLLLMYESAQRVFATSGILPPDFVSLYTSLSHPVFLFSFPPE